MNIKSLYKPVASAIAAGAILLSSVAMPLSAQELSPSGPNEALAPASGWVTLEPGVQHWFTFKYNYDSGTTPSQAFVELEEAVDNSISFEVWTPDHVRRWVNGEKVVAVGAGTESVNDDLTLTWVGSSAETETYYVIVENERSIASDYKLDIFGEDVSFTSAQFGGAMVAEEAAGNEVLASDELGLAVEDAEVAAIDGGNDPFSALAPSSEWSTLQPEEMRFFSFKYDYDNGNEDTEVAAAATQAIVELEMGSVNSIDFEIWTSTQVNDWQAGKDVEPVGRGTVKSELTGRSFHDTKLVWAGSAAASGTYYIVVENNNNVPAYFSLNVSGEDVTY